MVFACECCDTSRHRASSIRNTDFVTVLFDTFLKSLEKLKVDPCIHVQVAGCILHEVFRGDRTWLSSSAEEVDSNCALLLHHMDVNSFCCSVIEDLTKLDEHHRVSIERGRTDPHRMPLRTIVYTAESSKKLRCTNCSFRCM